MQMQFKKYSSAFGFEPIHKMTKDFGKTNTDTSTYRPDISLVRSFLGASGNYKKKFLYDFEDGKDNGETVQTFLRTKGLDITEIETAEKRITQIIEDKKASDEEKAELTKNQKELLDTIKGVREESSKGTSNTSDITVNKTE